MQKKKNKLYNNEIFYRSRNGAIKFYDDYSSVMSEGKYKATKGMGLKINCHVNKCFKDYQQHLHK